MKANTLGIRTLARSFAFFGGRLSPKFGKPCCKYGQDGKPLSKEKALASFEEVREFLPGWSLNEAYTSLRKFVYLNDFYKAPEIIKRVIDIDQMDTQNKPSVELINGDLLKIELKSHSVGGLSHVDFELAILLNGIDFESYHCIPVSGEKGYRREVREVKSQFESKKIEEMLKETANSKQK